MEHRTDDPVCGQLSRPLHARRARDSEHDADDLRAGSGAAGRRVLQRLNQLDVGIRKIFRIQKYQFSAQADIFNVANVSYVKNQNVTLGSSFGQPLDVLQPRLLRLAVQMKF